MKTEAELWKYRDALVTCRAIPCNCAGSLHAIECLQGDVCMAANIILLDWVLGERLEHDRMVEEIMAAAARHLAGS